MTVQAHGLLTSRTIITLTNQLEQGWLLLENSVFAKNKRKTQGRHRQGT